MPLLVSAISSVIKSFCWVSLYAGFFSNETRVHSVLLTGLSVPKQPIEAASIHQRLRIGVYDLSHAFSLKVKLVRERGLLEIARSCAAWQ